MKIMRRVRDNLAPVKQPLAQTLPGFYLIPETYRVDAPRISANHTVYAPKPVSNTSRPAKQKAIALPHPTLRCLDYLEGWISGFKQRVRQRIELAIAKVWSATKALGRRVLRWLAWKVFMPLSVMASIWVPSVTPAELPL